MATLLVRRGFFVLGAALCASLAAAEPGDAQAPAGSASQPIPQIRGGKVEQVTVDVVVLDSRGKPVKGLKKEDFTVLEEGQPKTIASFDVIEHAAVDQAEPAPGPPPPVAVNTGPTADSERVGRSFVILFDDLHLTPQNTKAAKAAVASFLDKGVAEGDRVTLIATSGSAWWSARIPEGREDLIAILKRLEGRKILETATERITDYEAVQIVYYHDTLVAGRVQDRLERYGTTLLGQAPDNEQKKNEMEIYARGEIDPYIESQAMQTYLKLKTRLQNCLKMIERATSALTEGRDRKALLLVSEGFVEDPSQDGVRRVIEAARRANAAIYFVDVAGLRALDPMYSAEFGPGLDTRDTMASIADLSREAEGAAALSADTGGFSVRDTNDFQAGIVRIGRESQSYYLIGYSPGDIPHDGRFRKIEVKVRGKYTVRARRGYYAPSPNDDETSRTAKGTDPVLQEALDTPTSVGNIPLRMTAYVMDDISVDHVRALIVADADVSELQFKTENGSSTATLDTLLVVAHRESGEAQRTDQQVEIRRRPDARPAAGPMWYSFLREVTLPVGTHQAKLVVRDPATNAVGTVTYEFKVPPLDHLRVSTPVLTDTLSNTGGAGPVPALLARRTFPTSAQLYCRFDVYGAGKGRDGLPKVRAGHLLRRRDGEVLGRSAPTLIDPTSLGALARMVQIPRRSGSPGDYALVLTVSDEVTGESRELVEPFTVTPPVTAQNR